MLTSLFVIVVVAVGLISMVIFALNSMQHAQDMRQWKRQDQLAHSAVSRIQTTIRKDVDAAHQAVEQQAAALANVQSDVRKLQQRVALQKTQAEQIAGQFSGAIRMVLEQSEAKMVDGLRLISHDMNAMLQSAKQQLSELGGMARDAGKRIEELDEAFAAKAEAARSALQHVDEEIDVLQTILQRIEMHAVTLDALHEKLALVRDQVAFLTPQGYKESLAVTAQYTDKITHIRDADVMYVRKAAVDQLVDVLNKMAENTMTIKNKLAAYQPAGDMAAQIPELQRVVGEYSTSVAGLINDLDAFDLADYQKRITALNERLDVLRNAVQIDDSTKDLRKLQGLGDLEALRQTVTEHSMAIANLHAHMDVQKLDERLTLNNRVCLDDVMVCLDEGSMKDLVARTTEMSMLS